MPGLHLKVRFLATESFAAMVRIIPMCGLVLGGVRQRTEERVLEISGNFLLLHRKRSTVTRSDPVRPGQTRSDPAVCSYCGWASTSLKWPVIGPMEEPSARVR